MVRNLWDKSRNLEHKISRSFRSSRHKFHGDPPDYKSDLEDKLQTYNKINGAIRRHFGKRMNKETKLRIHNITAKAALKFESEAWVLKKREEHRLEAAQMKFLRHLLGITKLDKEKNQCIRGKNGSTEHT